MNVLRRMALLGFVAVALSACDQAASDASSNKVQFNGVDITGADYGKALSLPDQDGRVRTISDFAGKVTVVFFGYTQCPDVCPTTMLELAQVKKSMGKDGDKIQGVFITIDPERDTPTILKSYMGSFDPSFIALRGTVAQTAATAKDFKVFFAKVPGKTEGSYTMDHTAGAYVIDGRGRMRIFERYGAGAEPLAADLKALLASG